MNQAFPIKYKRSFFLLFYFLLWCAPFTTQAANRAISNSQDSVWLFAYSTNEGRSGLLLAYSIDQENWIGIGPHHRFLFSDFGRWGAQKRMFGPDLFQDESGLWHCIWALNDGVGQIAHTTSTNLYDWGRQSYPEVMKGGDIKHLEGILYGDEFQISWKSGTGEDEAFFQTDTRDFKTYACTNSMDEESRLNKHVDAIIDGQVFEGVVVKISMELVDGLIKNYEWSKFHESQKLESMNDDPTRFANLKPIDIKISLQPEKGKNISNMLIGVFFEDISFSADGGLYAELIQNRDFEYQPSDNSGRNMEWNHWASWSYDNEKYGFIIDSVAPIHANNKYYAVLDGVPKDKGLVNKGWDGIVINDGDKYDFSVFARSIDGSSKEIIVRLTRSDGSGNLGETRIKKIGDSWKSYKSIITATGSVADGRLEIIPQKEGQLAMDMISLFPQKTFHSRKNGLRPDLAQTIADLNPKFVRFPGGCVAHGDGLNNIYRWKNSVGPIESRLPMRNIWGYHQTLGLGYYEYFQFCEDIKAEPVPVLAAGVPCQNSATGGHGQCGGIPMGEMDEYIQDILDLIEWANGDKTTEWGRKRVEAGHPQPFNLKYLGIGNEDLITDIFEERFTMIYEAVQEKYPEIIIIGTVGPTYMGTDYDQGWALAKKLNVPMVDEHYYQPPGWFLNNQDFYDTYDRNGPKVYLGEYAAHVPGRKMNMETALSEALYLASIERNGDVVHMTSFAPLLAKENHSNWNPDLVYFNNTEINLTVDYYVQQIFGQNSGQEYVPTLINIANVNPDVKNRLAVSVVKDQVSGDFIFKVVNLLPVEVNAGIDLAKLKIEKQKTMLEVITGQPKDEDVKPTQQGIEISDNLSHTFHPYSLNVFRVKTTDK